MNIVPTLFLAAVLAGPAHAQVCSGGSGGGVDATGNQCNSPHDVAAYTTGSGSVPPARATKSGGVHPSTLAVPPSIHPDKLSGPPSTPVVVAKSANRMASAAAPPSAPVKTAKIETGAMSPCSGGAEGGMDATGNQCGEPPAAAAVKLAARRL
jgi:hypothetical protein